VLNFLCFFEMSSPSKHETDPIGARDIDKESDRPKLGSKIATEKSVPSDGPDDRATNILTAPSSQLSFLIETVRPNLFITEIRMKATSTFIPSARMLFKALDELHSRFIRIKGYSSTYHECCSPPVLKLGIGFLFYYRVLKVMSQQGLTNSDQERCIHKIESKRPESGFIIPFPLIPFFQAICAFHPADKRFGPVCPVLPHNHGATAANHGALHPSLIGLLPNMTSILNQIGTATSIPPAGQQIPYYTAEVNTPLPANEVLAAHNAAGLNSWKNVDVGSQPLIRSPYFSSHRERSKVSNHYAGYSDYPPAFRDHVNRNDAEVNTWLSYLKLSNSITWIDSALAAVDLLCVPYSQNLPLSSLPTVNGAYNSIVYTYTNEGNVFADDTVARDHQTPYLSFETTGKCFEPISDSNTTNGVSRGVSRLELEISALTQLNVTFPANYFPGSDAVGQFNGTLRGPYFNPNFARVYAHTDQLNAAETLRTTVQEALAHVKLDKRS
jgi:hypothetical protein